MRQNDGSGKGKGSPSYTAAQKLALKKAQRTDAAGRSGMGESASSNMRFKGGSSYSSANRTANAAGTTASKSGGDYRKAYDKSIVGAADYAWKRKGK